MSHGPYIHTRETPQVAPPATEQPALSPREKAIPRTSAGSRSPDWDLPQQPAKTPAPVPNAAQVQVPETLRAEIEAAAVRYPDPRSVIIPALWAAQRMYGWCSPEAVEQVATVLRRTPAELMAVATFYDMFETDPVGEHTIYVCTNISCSLRGGDELLARFEAASAGREDEFHVRGFECLGACDIAPMISVDGVYAGPINADEVEQILEDVAAGRPIVPERQLQVRKSVDPRAGDKPGSAGDGAGAGDHDVEQIAPDPKRHSDPAHESDPEATDAPDERRATGQDPEDDKA